MKKIIMTVAVAAFAFGAFAAGSRNGFEHCQVGPYDTATPDGPGDAAVYFTTADDGDEAYFRVNAYAGDPYDGSYGFPTGFSDVGEKYLQFKTRFECPLVRSINPCENGWIGAAWPLADDLWLDLLLMPTTLDEQPDWTRMTKGANDVLRSAKINRTSDERMVVIEGARRGAILNVDDKLQLFYFEDEEGEHVDLYAQAGHLNSFGQAPTLETYRLTGKGIPVKRDDYGYPRADVWQRVTIRAVKDITQSGLGIAGFQIFINGMPVFAEKLPVSETCIAAAGDSLSAEVKSQMLAGAFFPAYGWGEVPQSQVSFFGFEGQGALDDLSVSTSAPEFWKEHKVTFNLGEHGKRIGGGELEQLVRHGFAATAPKVEPDENCLFMGWFTAEEGGEKVEDWTITKPGQTFYAHWAGVLDVTARQRYPWNGLVDIDYSILGDARGLGLGVCVADRQNGKTFIATKFLAEPSLAEGRHRITWDSKAENVDLISTNVIVTVSCFNPNALYYVIDIESGRVKTLDTVPPGGWTDEHKTTKLVLRRIEPGTFTMGSRPGEVGRNSANEDLHEVTLTKPFYVGVFEVTQRQWELVMGTKPSYFSNVSCYETRPVDSVSYRMIRGSSDGANWPLTNEVDEESFLGELRAKTMIDLDLPTEAQWECACRAGKATAINSGANLTNVTQDAAMDAVGRYRYDYPSGNTSYSSSSDLSAGTAAVGSYLPNEWGLYDMHGNVGEWCVDWYAASLGKASVTNPLGAVSGYSRVMRGGSFISGTRECRSAYRSSVGPSATGNGYGFRLACSADLQVADSVAESATFCMDTRAGGDALLVEEPLNVAWSSLWNDGDEAEVLVDGQPWFVRAGEGTEPFYPTNVGLHGLTHVTRKDGVPVGETLTARLEMPATLTRGVVKDGAAVFPEGTTAIAAGAFAGRADLVSVQIPASVSAIDSAAFDGCANLKSVTIRRKDYDMSVFPAGCEVVYDIDYAVVFDLAGHGSRTGGGELKQTVRHGSAAIAPEVVAERGWVFMGWDADFSSVTDNRTILAQWAHVWFDAKVGDVTWTYRLRDGIAIVDNNGNVAISGASGSGLVVPATLGGYPVRAIGAGAFAGCGDVETIVLPQNLVEVGEGAFAGCSNLVSVVLPEGVTAIPPRAFEGCAALEELVIPAGVQTICEEAFAGCASLKAVEIPEGVTEIAVRTFAGCEKLSSVKLPESLERIGAEAFVGCAALGSVSIPANVSEIGENAFGDCNGLGSVRFYGQPPTGIWTSGLVNEKVTIHGPADVTISPADRTVFGTDLAVTLATSWAGGVVRYTLDGSAPTAESPAFDGITIHNKTTVRAATFVEGLRWSEIEEATYGVGKVATPTASSTQGGTFYHNGNRVSLDCATTGVEIRYTFGGEPTVNSALYMGPFEISRTTTVKAKAFGHPDYVDSDVMTAEFVRAWEGLATPAISPEGGLIEAECEQVTITCESEDVTIYYTLDGSRPSATNGRVYSGPFKLYQSASVKAIATKYDWADSEVASVTFTRGDQLGEAINYFGAKVTNDANAPWTVDVAESHDGVSAVRSAAVEGGESGIKLTVRGAGRLSFWWKASCEEVWDGEYYDYGSFKVGSEEKAKIAGQTDWQRVVVDFETTGKHTLHWDYVKDEDSDDGKDCIWVDQVVWIPADGSGVTLTTGVPVPYAWLEGYGLGVTTDFETAANAKTGKRSAFGKELTVWEDYVTGTNPTNLDSVFRTFIDMSSGVPKIAWEPDLNENGIKHERIYQVWGAKDLNAQWFKVEGDGGAYRFFKVTVGLP